MRDITIVHEFEDYDWVIIDRHTQYQPFVACYNFRYEDYTWEMGQYFETVREALDYVTAKYLMGGKLVSSFYTGGDWHQVRAYEDSDYGEIYKIWVCPEGEEKGYTPEPTCIYTVYRKESLDTFIQNIYDANYAYDMNI